MPLHPLIRCTRCLDSRRADNRKRIGTKTSPQRDALREFERGQPTHGRRTEGRRDGETRRTEDGGKRTHGGTEGHGDTHKRKSPRPRRETDGGTEGTDCRDASLSHHPRGILAKLAGVVADKLPIFYHVPPQSVADCGGLIRKLALDVLLACHRSSVVVVVVMGA